MNKAGILSGRTETPLTDKGHQQAVKTGQDIKHNLPKIDLIICSPFERAYDTAKHIAEQIGYPVDKIQKNSLFIERTFGILEATMAADFFADHTYEDFDRVEGAETTKDLDIRAARALKYLKSLKSYDNILIVGHGSFGRALRRAVNHLSHTHEYNGDQTIPNAAIVELI
jgi:probable phosphoglycerate mutase